MKVLNKRKLVLTILGATIGVYLAFEFILPLVYPFIFAYAVAALILPVTKMLERKCRIPRTIGGTITLIVLLVITGVGLFYLGKNLLEQFQMLVKNIPIYQSMIIDTINSFCSGCDEFLGLAKGEAMAFFESNMNTIILEVQNSVMPMMTEHTIQAAFAVVKVVGALLFAVISILLIVQDAEEIGNIYRKLPIYKDIKAVTSKLSGAGTAYLKAQVIIMSIISVINVCGLLLIGNEYALLLGIGIAILDALPVFGGGTIFIPWAIFSFFSKDIYTAAILVSLYLITQFIRQILEPKLIGDKIGIKPIFTIMAMYVGVSLFGILGFILGPIALIIIISIVKSINLVEEV